MAIKLSQPLARKITVTLSSELLARLNEHVPARQRSRFIEQAIEEKLALIEQLAALDETAGAWSDENHPEMATEDDIEQWVGNLRNTWALTERLAN
ncbi:MAG: ribbon-helix-helix protein, CopG family [Caldilineaceae bacterium]